LGKLWRSKGKGICNSQNRKIAWQVCTMAGNTRKEFEAKTGKKIVTKINAKILGKNPGNMELT
jgi:hypothetical protein